MLLCLVLLWPVMLGVSVTCAAEASLLTTSLLLLCLLLLHHCSPSHRCCALILLFVAAAIRVADLHFDNYGFTGFSKYINRIDRCREHECRHLNAVAGL